LKKLGTSLFICSKLEQRTRNIFEKPTKAIKVLQIINNKTDNQRLFLFSQEINDLNPH